MGDKFYTNENGRPTLKEITAAGVSLLDSSGYYSSNNLEDLAIELYGRSNKNYCINGNFDIWQRGTSFTNPANFIYTADRVQISSGVDGGTPPTIVHSMQTLTPGELDKSFYYYRINANGTGSAYGNSSYYATMFQQIENGTRLLCGLNKKVTFSFYARSNIAGRIVVIEAIQWYGTGGSYSALERLTPLRITLTSSWTKYAYTFTTNTLSGKTFGTNKDDKLTFQLWTQGGAAYNSIITSPIAWASGNIDIAQVQINAGDTALDYVAPTFEDELRKCMRYYEDGDGYRQKCVAGLATANLSETTQEFYKVPKRIVATPNIYDGLGAIGKVTFSNISNGNIVSVVNASKSGFNISAEANGNTYHWGYYWNVDAEF